MKTLGDFIPNYMIPNRPGFPTANSPAMIYYTTVIAEGATSFHFFNYMTKERIPLENIPEGKLCFLCDRFVERLSAAERKDK